MRLAQISRAEQLASLPLEERQAVLAHLSVEARRTLRYTWES